MINASSLLAPGGEIEPEFFPEEDLDKVTERLDAYLTEGYAKAAALSAGTDRENAATAWAYYRAYSAIYRRLLAAPSTWSLADEGSASYTQKQIESFQSLAAAKLEEFEVWVPVTAPSVASALPLSSGSTYHTFAW